MKEIKTEKLDFDTKKEAEEEELSAPPDAKYKYAEDDEGEQDKDFVSKGNATDDEGDEVASDVETASTRTSTRAAAKSAKSELQRETGDSATTDGEDDVSSAISNNDDDDDE